MFISICSLSDFSIQATFLRLIPTFHLILFEIIIVDNMSGFGFVNT